MLTAPGLQRLKSVINKNAIEFNTYRHDLKFTTGEEAAQSLKADNIEADEQGQQQITIATIMVNSAS